MVKDYSKVRKGIIGGFMIEIEVGEIRGKSPVFKKEDKKATKGEK